MCPSVGVLWTPCSSDRGASCLELDRRWQAILDEGRRFIATWRGTTRVGRDAGVGNCTGQQRAGKILWTVLIQDTPRHSRAMAPTILAARLRVPTLSFDKIWLGSASQVPQRTSGCFAVLRVKQLVEPSDPTMAPGIRHLNIPFNGSPAIVTTFSLRDGLRKHRKVPVIGYCRGLTPDGTLRLAFTMIHCITAEVGVRHRQDDGSQTAKVSIVSMHKVFSLVEGSA